MYLGYYSTICSNNMITNAACMIMPDVNVPVRPHERKGSASAMDG